MQKKRQQAAALPNRPADAQHPFTELTDARNWLVSTQERGNDMPTKNTVTGVTCIDGATDSAGKPRRRRERAQARKRVPMGIALRRHGIDEHTIAETYAFTLDALKGIVPVKDSDKKLLIDFVKECEKHLEEDAKAAPGAPLRVRLVHNVARPQRGEVQGAPESDRISTERVNASDRRQGSGDDLEDGQEEDSSERSHSRLPN